MFRCLDEDPQFSILFTHLGNSNEYVYAVKRLYKEYEDQFNFNIINYSLFKCTHQSIQYTEYLKCIIVFSAILLPMFFISSINFFIQSKKSKQKAEIAIQENNKLKEELKIIKQNNTDITNNNIELKDALKIQKSLIDNYFTNFKDYLKAEIKYDKENKIRQNVENELNKSKTELAEVERLNIQLKKEKESINNELNKSKTELAGVERLNIQLKKEKESINNELNKSKTKLAEVEKLNALLLKEKNGNENAFKIIMAFLIILSVGSLIISWSK